MYDFFFPLRMSKSICSGLSSGVRALLGPSQRLASRHVHSIATGLGRNTDNLATANQRATVTNQKETETGNNLQ